MSDLKSQIEISADASGVEAGVSKAKRSLRDLGTTAKVAGKKASEGLGDIGNGAGASASKVDAATRNLIGSIQRTTAAMQAGSKSGSEYFKVLAAQRGVNVDALKPYLDQLDAASVKQAKTGISAAQMSASLRGVPAQFTDIAVALQGGQRPLTVFLQQGGQLKDMFGGAGPAAKALGGYIAGLINPFTVAAGAAAALAYAYNQGSKEGDAYAKALILSGNAAGTTAGQLQDMAKRIDAVSGTQSEAAAALAEFAGSGDVAGESLERFSAIAVRMEKATGQAVSETVKQFSELGKSPVDASVKLNETTRFLTEGIYQQIKALQDQGRTADAAALAQKAYADTLDTRLTQINSRLGTLERGWNGVTGAAKEAWDAMLNVGRASSPTDAISQIGEQIAAVRKQIAASGENGRASLGSQTTLGQELAALLDKQAILQENLRLENRSAAVQKETVEKTQARIQFDRDGAKFLADSVKLEREIAKARIDGAAAGASQAEIEKRIADIRASHKDMVSKGLQIDKSQLGLDVEAIKSANDQMVGSYSRSESIVSALHSARLIDDRQYYESKRGLIELESQANEAALQKQIDRYRQEKLSGKDKLDNDKKIAELESKLAIQRADTAAKLQVNSIQEGGAGYKGRLDVLNQLAAVEARAAMQNQSRVDQIRTSLLDQVEAENDAYGRRLTELVAFRDARVENESEGNRLIEQETERHLKWMSNMQAANDLSALSMASSAADQMYQLFEKAGKERTALAKALFVTQKALSIAEIIVNTEKGAAAALGFGPFGIPMSTIIRTMGYASAGVVAGTTIAEVSGGRALGGPVSAGNLYQVNERGPELLQSGGKQYLMMGSQGGSVTPNNQLGGSGAITIINQTSGNIGKVTERSLPNGERALILEEAKNAVAASFADPNSTTSRSLNRHFNVPRSR